MSLLRVCTCCSVGSIPDYIRAVTGHHFARPGIAFGPHCIRLASRHVYFAPSEERELLRFGYGITNLVARATATADELASEELVGRDEAEIKGETLPATSYSSAGHRRLPDGVCTKNGHAWQQPEHLAKRWYGFCPIPVD